MSIQVSAEIIGVKELNNALNELPKSLAKSALLRALKKVGKPIADDAGNRAPERTGEGAKSIKVRSNRRLKPVGVSIGPDKKHFYMSFQEFGTMKQAAQPFLRPSWDLNAARVPKELGKELWPILQKSARTLRKKAEAGTLGKRTLKALRTR